MKTVSTSARRRLFLAHTAASLAIVAVGAGFSWSAQADTLQNVTTNCGGRVSGHIHLR